MNILQLEQERTNLKEKLTAQYSTQARLLFLFSFFDKVLSIENNNLIDAFLPEFISEYVFCLKNFSVFGMKPRIHESIIHQAEQIKNGGHTSGFEEFSETLDRLKNDIEKLHKILNGERTKINESKAYFPLLEEDAIKETGHSIGILESVTIKVHSVKKENKFIIVPSEKEIEEKISEQVKLSWLNAIRIANKYIKRIHPHHEVIISFDKKAGFCKGNSLGTALTLAFIEEILKTYNSPVSIRVGEGIAFTGGMDEQGIITNTSQEIIKKKTELVFFSNVNLLVVPKQEETKAFEKLAELKKEFPERNFKIIGIEDINDLFDRRTIVEIKKQPVIIRSGKFLKKNWVSAAIAVLLTIILSFLFVLDFDDNPASILVDRRMLYIKNKNGRVLWTKKVLMSMNNLSSNAIYRNFRLIDVNGDGSNELIANSEWEESNGNQLPFSPVICYNYKGEILWKYSFRDQVYSKNGELNTEFNSNLLDTLTFNGQQSLFLFASSGPSFSSAICRIDLKTGKRLPGTFWCSGHIIDAIIKDIEIDGHFEIVGIGYDNGYEDAVFFAYTIDTLTKVRPTTDSYLIRNFPISEMTTYIRFPKSDLDNYKNQRSPGLFLGSFSYVRDNNYYQFSTWNPLNHDDWQLGYKVDCNFKDINVVIDSDFRVQRDTLVAHGILQPPYTDTDEYVELQKSKILYWKDGNWVKREDLD